MSLADELRRIDSGSSPGEVPRGVAVIGLRGVCNADAVEVAAKVRSVLRIVLASGAEAWPTDDEWLGRLPEWFKQEHAPSMTQAEAQSWLEKWQSMTPDEQARVEAMERWALPDWLHWLHPDERDWQYWDCSAVDESTVRLRVVVQGLPIAHGALDWLIRAAGARQILEEESI